MNRSIISVGSNIEPEKHCAQAIAMLQKAHTVLGKSKFQMTAPVGYQHQPDFLNGAFYVSTTLSYLEFNHYLKQIEKRLGRVKGPIKSGPRTMDLDIIVWNDQIVHHESYHQGYVYPFVQELIQTHQIQLQEPVSRELLPMASCQ